MAAPAASTVEEPFFWLPSDFLTDDDFLFMDKDTNTPLSLSSRSVFPYRFETDACQQRLEKLWMLSTSPVAYAGNWDGRSFGGGSSNGSPNAVLTAPFGGAAENDDDVGDLIYRAAGELAKLRLSRDREGFGLGHGLVKDRGLMGPQTRGLPQYYPEVENPSVFPHSHLLKQQCGRTGHSGWGARHNPTRRSSGLLAGDGGGAAAARSLRAGTGVFLPRGYGNNINNNNNNNESNAYSSDSHRKQPGCSNAPSPVLAQTKSFNYLNDSARTQPNLVSYQQQPQYGMEMGTFLNYDSLMARRQAIVLQKRRSLLLASLVEGRDLYLPHEWSY